MLEALKVFRKSLKAYVVSLGVVPFEVVDVHCCSLLYAIEVLFRLRTECFLL